MVRSAFTVRLVGLSLLAAAGACGSVDSSAGVVNAPCTRDSDCEGSLSCQSGVCTLPPDDAGVSPRDAGPSDAATDG